MKILSITAQKPHSTGSGTYLTELVKAFDEAGHKQAVVAGIYPNDGVNFPVGIEFYPVFYHSDVGFNIVGMSDSMPYPSTKYSELDDAMIREFERAFIKVIGEAISSLKPDIILCHHLFLLTALVREHFPNETVYGICHGSDLRQMVKCPKLAETICPQIQKLDRVFALHNEQKIQIEKLFKGIDDEKISVIGSGYNAKLFNLEGRAAHGAGELCRICFAGKVSKAKGAAELIDAVYELNAESKLDFELVIAGGCQDENIRDRLKNLPENVSYLGLVSQPELANVFKSCDIFILPSYFEGLGLVLIEAMASGLIPISTDIPGIRDWINENVANPNVRYIPMPEMYSIDEPTVSGREQFINNIKSVLSETIHFVSNYSHNKTCVLPDTSNITWYEVSNKILNL